MKWNHKAGLVLVGLAGVWWAINYEWTFFSSFVNDSVTVVLALIGLFLATNGKIFGSIFR
jgi:hypothetical protein